MYIFDWFCNPLQLGRKKIIISALLVLAWSSIANSIDRNTNNSAWEILNNESKMQNKDKLLQTKVCKKCDLSNLDLKKADLKNADLAGANLSGSNLSFADLSESNLYGANLKGARLRGTNFTRTNLQNANLTSVNEWYSAQFAESMLSGAIWLMPDRKCKEGSIGKCIYDK